MAKHRPLRGLGVAGSRKPCLMSLRVWGSRMGSKAVFTFTDATGEYHVSRHYGCKPDAAAHAYAQAVSLALELPEYDAGDMAASFITANRDGVGNMRLIPQGAIEGVAPADIQYHYVLMQAKNGQLILRAYAVDNTKAFMAIEFFYGRLVDFMKAHCPEAYDLYRRMYPSKRASTQPQTLVA